ncbi:ABC transporter permease [Rhizobium sp. L1K21]|uniref:ABC transporter permease n=1 Tax=Rhizobium sp. L1K21 TaxID=2954933 RepID=UPI0020934D08|nr:ABC transporter permease [Rhizobium sp. L1K21]MCO6187592.1 ABC transporter permease [Rhizobium sp. L1K21]
MTADSNRKRLWRASPGLSLIQAWWLPIICILAWWFLSAGSKSFYFPSLETILAVLWRDLTEGPLLSYMWISLANMAAGLVISIVLGVAFGLLIGEFGQLRDALMPMLNFLRSVPPAAIVPLVIVALGTDAAPKIFIIALTCFWPILLNTIDGVRGMTPQLRDTASAFKIPYSLYFRRVLLMAALPQIMAGIRIAVAVALVLMVIGEFFGASEGLGFYINENKQRFAMTETWAGTVLIGFLGYLLSAIFVKIEAFALSWYFQSENAND